jgi:hypothetical protein
VKNTIAIVALYKKTLSLRHLSKSNNYEKSIYPLFPCHYGFEP